MIAMVSGVVAAREADSLVVQTDGGVGYRVTVPTGVAERLPAPGARVSLHTELVVKEDGWALYGFDRPGERLVFQRLLGASGFGPKLALALLSALGPERTVRSIRSRDLAALSSVGGIGRKKAERLSENEAMQRQSEDERLLFRCFEQFLELVDDHVGELPSRMVTQRQRAGVIELHRIGHREQRTRACAHPDRLVVNRPVEQMREAAFLEKVRRDTRLGGA